MSAHTQQRIPYLDFLKFFAIASVLLGHSVEQTTGNDFWDNPIWSFIYTYHMPLFMLLCGYFFGSSLKLSLGELIRKKFVQLIIPSLSAFALMVIFVTLTGYNPCPELMDFSWFGFMNAVWFLKCVFFCYLIGWLCIKTLGNVWLSALISTLLVHLFSIFNTDNINFMLPMFWLGYLCHLYQPWIDRHRKVLLGGSLLLFAALLPFWSGRLTVYMVPIQIMDWSQFQIDGHNLLITLYRMVIGMAGSLVFFLLSPWMYDRIKHLSIAPVLDRMGKCTLGIYWVQTFLLECTWHGIGLYVDTANSFWVGPLIALLELIVCYQVVLLFKKNRYTRFMFLGEKFYTLLIGIMAFTFSSCTSGPSPREAFVRSYLERYPEATLQDIYKGSFQDVFGPAHILTNREAVIRYINHEIKSAEKFEEADYIPCGWQGNFLQVNLKVIADGRIPLDTFVDAFMASANGIDTTLTQTFVADWELIQQAVRTAAPHLEGFSKDSTLLAHLLQEGKYVVHHSRKFNEHYHPHYRIIRRDLFEEKILPYIAP